MAALDGDPRSSSSEADPFEDFSSNRDEFSQSESEGRVAERLKSIWETVLQQDNISPDDDFFEIGGDSLSAVMILTRISQEFQIKVTEAELFAARSIRGLTSLLRSSIKSVTGSKNGITVRGIGSPYPATRAQQRLWYMDQSMSDPAVYNVPFLLRWQGPFDLDALQRAFERLEERHEILRTRLVQQDGRLCQVVGDLEPVRIPLTDLRTKPAAEMQGIALAEMVADAKATFDLKGRRLYRVKLFRTSTDEYLWGINFHHTITDGWSFGVFFSELEAFYEQEVSKKPAQLAPLPIQYGDYARWEPEHLNSPAVKEHLAYWTKQLAGPIPSMDLPCSKARPERRACRGGYYQFVIPRKLLNAIDKLGRQESVTRFMIGLAAWKMLLARLTGQMDITVGSPVAGRTRPETEPLIGMFTNMLALRTSLAGNPTIRDILERVRQTRLDAFVHQEVPIDLLVEQINPSRDQSHQAFFQTAFYYQNVSILPEKFSRAKLTNIPVHNGTSMFDLRLVLEDGPFDSVWGWLEFDSELFEIDEMKKLVGRFLSILEQATANPNLKLADVSVLTATERQQILFDWNNTAGSYPDQETLPDAFLRQVQQQPDAIALVTAKETVTYRQLHQRVEHVALHLHQLGVKSGELVGVCLNRSPDMVAAVLAITRAGGAYVPMDPSYPSDRLQFMLEDTATKYLITNQALAQNLPHENVELILVDRVPAVHPAKELPEQLTTPDHVAYVIYTSGSTGKPKGVVVRHRAAINTIDWVNREFQVSSTDRLLFVTSLSFDLSVYDIFGVLGAGGSLYVTNEQELREPQRLADLLHQGHITMWDSAPAALQQVVPFFRIHEKNTALRLVMLSGDWIPVTLPDQVRRVFTNAKIRSLGGATEAAIWSNWFPVEEVNPSWASIPYGKPIRNAVYHILDESLQPVPVDVPGELHIGGVCLADGYLNREELTSQRFIPDPFRLGERLYKTGDLAKYWSDGNIEFLGRIDHQVKVRGFRVELGEIESALSQHPTIREAVVKPFRDSTNVVLLTAFIVAKTRVETSELITYLKGRMPEYMVPTSFVFLDAMPLTPNGKLDRNRLVPPTISATARLQSKAKTPPANDLEATIAEAFSEVLGIGAVGRDDHFFDLGGHSLKAAELVARIQKYLGFELRLASLLAAPTVRELAIMIQQKLELGQGCVVPLNEEGPYPPLFMIAGAGGHVFAFQRFARLLGPEFPAYGMKAIGVDGTEPPLERVEDIAERYLPEILKHRPKGPYVLSGYSVGGLVAYELALRMQDIGLEVAKVIMFDTFAPGYPKKKLWIVRAGIHAKNFLFGSGYRSKWRYLKQRFQNLRHRIFTALGYGHLDLPDYPGITGLSAEIIKRVWAGLERANTRYWPSRKLNAQLVIARSDQQEMWAATQHDDPLLGWRDWVTQPIDTFAVPAGHMEFFDDRNVTFLVNDMRAVIRATRPDIPWVPEPVPTPVRETTAQLT